MSILQERNKRFIKGGTESVQRVNTVHERRVIRTWFKYEGFILKLEIYTNGVKRYEKFISSWKSPLITKYKSSLRSMIQESEPLCQ